MKREDLERFVELKYNGDRFNGGRLPVDVLNDLLVFREIVLEIAKNIWREQHPNRKRLPKNFDEFFRLNLSEISDGSAVATLSREGADLTPLFEDGPILDIFDNAQDVIIEGIIAANEDRPIQKIPKPLIERLGAMGKRLQKNEKISLQPRTHDQRGSRPIAAFSSKTRERLFKQAGVELESHIESFGILSGSEESSSSVAIISELGRFSAKVPHESIRAVYDGRIGSVVEFSLDASLNDRNKIKKVRSLHYADLVDDGPNYEKVDKRLDKFAQYQDGWFDGEGVAFGQRTINVTRDLAKFVSASFDEVSAYPMPDGSIRLEFDRGDIDASLQVFASELIFMHAVDLETDRDYSQEHRGITEELLADIMNVAERVNGK